MKNLLKVGFFLFAVSIVAPSNATGTLSNSVAPLSASAESGAIINRLDEIESMDKTKLSRPEKRELRREVKAIKKNMDSSGGVYISVGALILIILLLIILL